MPRWRVTRNHISNFSLLCMVLISQK